MEKSGNTTEGLSVMAGVGSLCFTHGIPLEMVLGYFKEKNLVVDWIDYISSALLDGHSVRNIRARIESAVSDIYGKMYANEVMIRTDKTLSVLSPKASK